MADVDRVDQIKVHLLNFLLEVVPPILECSRKDLQTVLTRKDRTGADLKIRRFVEENACRLLVVGKEVVTADDKGRAGKHRGGEDTITDGGEGGVITRLFVSFEIDRRVTSAASLAFIKRPNVSLMDLTDRAEVEGASSPDDSQSAALQACGQYLQMLNLGFSDGDTNVFELLST
eukprot:Lankesteria_metandrocarpae@DN5640_c0_g1_i1.p1